MKLLKVLIKMMNKKLSLLALSVILSLSLGGCTLLHTDYARTAQMPSVDSYKHAKEFIGPLLSEKFWQDFKDEKLNSLIEDAFKANIDLRVAAKNVEKARYALDYSKTDRIPTLSASLGSTAKRALDYHDSTHKSSSGSFSLSYQTDLFGKVEAEVESSYENFRATAYDYWAMRLTVIQSVSEAYWQYAYAKEAVMLGEHDLEDSKKRLELVEGRYNAGSISEVDLTTARINHLQVVETLHSRLMAQDKARAALATLLGTTADKDFATADLGYAAIPKFSLDIPAKLFARRPDLMEYEALARKAYADYNQAKMAFFPDITLSAGITTGSSSTLANFLANPVGALGAAVTLPFLNFTKLESQRKQAYTDIEIADLNFVSAYIKAVQEVFDSVAAIKYYRVQVDTTYKELQLSKRNYEQYFERYKSGLEQLSDFIDAADTLRSAAIAYLQAKRDNLNATMELMISLGGDTEQAIAEEDKRQQEQNTGTATGALAVSASRAAASGRN